MTKLNVTQTTPGRSELRLWGLDRPLPHLAALVHEWRARRNIKHSLRHLSDFYLRDIGLTQADAEAACFDSFNRSASCALRRAAESRMSNW